MIFYKDIIGKLRQAGYTTYKIRKENIFGQKTLDAIKNNLPIRTDTINRLCTILGCQPGEILEYVPDEGPIYDLSYEAIKNVEPSCTLDGKNENVLREWERPDIEIYNVSENIKNLSLEEKQAIKD